MKCRQCGNSFHSGVTCPLCGHKNIGVYHCAVCDKSIHHGQGHCPSCGTPTIYCKKVEVVVKGDVIDYTTHSNASHTYESQEQYDYKKNAYQYAPMDNKKKKVENTGHPYTEQYNYKKEAYNYNENQGEKKKDSISSWFETVKEKQVEMQSKMVFDRSAMKGTGLKGNLVTTLICIALIGLVCMAVFEESSYDGEAMYTPQGNASSEQLSIIGTNTNLMEQANFSNGQWASLYENELHVTDGAMYTLDKQLMEPPTMDNEAVKYIYQEGMEAYYLNQHNELYYKNYSIRETVLINASVGKAVYLDGCLYYHGTLDDQTLYQYDITKQEETLLTKEYQNVLRSDTTTNRLYYLNTNSQLVAVSNLKNEQKTFTTYLLPVTNYLVEGNTLYDYDGTDFCTYDLVSQQMMHVIEFEDVKQYARVEDGYLCLNENGSIYKVFDNGDKELILETDIMFVEFQLAGDKLILKDENEGEIFVYVADLFGDYAYLGF